MLKKQTIYDIINTLRREWGVGWERQPHVLNDKQIAIRMFSTDLSTEIASRQDESAPAPEIPAQAEFIPETLANIERQHILAMLEYRKWNKSETARLCGIERSTLDRKLKLYGITRPE